MAYLQLAPHVGFGLVEGRPVFLDLRRDRYLALDPAAEAIFHAFLRRPEADMSVDRADIGDLKRLLATGLVTLTDTPARLAPARPETPRRSGLGSGQRGRPGVRDLAEAALLLRRSRQALRNRALDTLVTAHRERATTGAAVRNPETISTLAEGFHRARALVPIAPCCLQDSLALLDWLARRGAYPTLVFGVTVAPFGAHCWIQSGDLVLNDALDTVVGYTPVMAVPCG